MSTVGKRKKQEIAAMGERDTKRDQYTIVLEDLRGQFRVFGEGLANISDTLDQHTTILEQHTATLDQHTVQLNQHAAQLQGITQRLIAVEADLAFVKEQLAIIRHNQVTRDEFKLLETRVARLERAMQK